MNSHQRRKKRRQWNRNEIIMADWKEFGRQLQVIAAKAQSLEFLETLANISQQRKPFKPLPYQESMVGTLENAQILSVKAWARKYWYNI